MRQWNISFLWAARSLSSGKQGMNEEQRPGCSVSGALPCGDNSRKGKWLCLLQPSCPLFVGLLASVLHIYCVFSPHYMHFFFSHCIWNNCSLHHCSDFLHPEFCFLLLFILNIPIFISFFVFFFSLFFPPSYVLFAGYPDIQFLFRNGYIFLHSMGLPNRFALRCRISLWIAQFVSFKGTWMFLPSFCSEVFNSVSSFPHITSPYTHTQVEESFLPQYLQTNLMGELISIMFFAQLFGNLIPLRSLFVEQVETHKLWSILQFPAQFFFYSTEAALPSSLVFRDSDRVHQTLISSIQLYQNSSFSCLQNVALAIQLEYIFQYEDMYLLLNHEIFLQGWEKLVDREAVRVRVREEK